MGIFENIDKGNKISIIKEAKISGHSEALSLFQIEKITKQMKKKYM